MDKNQHKIPVKKEIEDCKQVEEEALRAREKQYREQQAFLESIYNGVDSDIFVVDVTEEGDFRYAGNNEAHQRASGLKAENFVGKTPEELIPHIPPEVAASVRANYQRCLNSGKTIEYDEKITIGGRDIWSLTRLTPLKDESGRVYRIIGISTDITERKQAKEALQKARDELENQVEERTVELRRLNAELVRASRHKDEFLANMSHELRNPLNVILGMSEALQDQIYGELNGKVLNGLRRIEESGRHLLQLITDILDISKIGAGKLELTIGPVSVKSVCEASVMFIKQLAYKKRIKVVSTCDQNITTFRADELRLKQVLVNLLSNAVKFTPEGGSVGLEVEGDPEQQRITFTVWDTGTGIAEEDMERLFQPFEQLERTRSHHHEGTGLGLSLVYRLVELHGGSISVESEVGKGSRFTVSLPWKESGDREMGSVGDGENTGEDREMGSLGDRESKDSGSRAPTSPSPHLPISLPPHLPIPPPPHLPNLQPFLSLRIMQTICRQ